MDFTINQENFEKLISVSQDYLINQETESEIEEKRLEFTNYYNKEKISKLQKDEYFAGLGKKQGCFSYDIEFSTRGLGGIGGGSKYKFGYEKDFEKIKELLIEMASFQDRIDQFYLNNGELTEKAIELIALTKEIKGLITGRSLTGKFLRLYYPKTFIQIFNHQEHFLQTLFLNYEKDAVGLELFLKNNFLLLQIKNKIIEKLPEKNESLVTNFHYVEILYKTFPVINNKIENSNDSTTESADDIDALEVQHFQTLIHRNRKIIFPNFEYIDKDYQNEHYGHFSAEEIGIIDFLFQDKNNDLFVIELKRTSTDKTVGQILRYIGWVQENIAEKKQRVFGIILSQTKDITLDFAIKPVNELITHKKINLNISIE